MRKKSPVAELLQTSNQKDQVAQIQSLINLANAPVLTIVISFDSRNQRVDAKQVGAQAPNEIVQQVLDAAKNLFNQQEIAKQVELATQEDNHDPMAMDHPEGILPADTEEGEPINDIPSEERSPD